MNFIANNDLRWKFQTQWTIIQLSDLFKKPRLKETWKPFGSFTWDAVTNTHSSGSGKSASHCLEKIIFIDFPTMIRKRRWWRRQRRQQRRRQRQCHDLKAEANYVHGDELYVTRGLGALKWLIDRKKYIITFIHFHIKQGIFLFVFFKNNRIKRLCLFQSIEYNRWYSIIASLETI